MTEIQTDRRARRRLLLASVSALILSVSGAYAQETDDTDTEVLEEEERITVTGSRLRRDTFTSASPLQVIDGELARSIGLVNTADIITQSTVAAGTQLDATFSGGSGTAVLEDVPVNGLGGATVQLRGLEPERTLVILNGRRLAPAGVRGAPTQPDLNLIPSSIIERVEILTDGASSVYGADAVAGVVNIITRDEFEGLELNGFYARPEEEGGETWQFNGIMGTVFDRGHITIAAEYFERARVATGDRDFSFCNRNIERNPDNGRVVTGPCEDRTPDNAAAALGGETGLPFFLYFQPGNFNTSTGIPEFETEANLGGPAGVATGRFADLQDFYNLQDERREADLVSPLRRFSLFVNGAFDVNFWESDELFFEFSYNNRQQILRAAEEQIFPGIPSLIPQVDGNGNLMAHADGNLMLFANPQNPYAGLALQRTADQRAAGTLGATDYNQIIAFPVFSSPDFGQVRDVEVDQWRGVLGLRGDIPLSWEPDSSGLFGLKNWTYEFTGIYSRSRGTSSQDAMNEPNLAFMLDTMRLDTDGTVICGPVSPNRNGADFGFLNGAPGCQVTDFFNVMRTKQFTDADKDYLIGLRTNQTVVTQTVASAFLTGDIAELPAGAVPLAFGFEFREDKIDSNNDLLTTNFQLASESANEEGNTRGATNFKEFFIETEVPFLRDLPLAHSLTVNAAARWTEEANFGSQWTWRAQGVYEPVEWFTIRGTYGTSFRAPNLREQFLADAVRAESNNLDPCGVPGEAQILDPATNQVIYVPALDPRNPATLQNCFDDGLDPTQIGLGATQNFNVLDGGSEDLKAETSTSWTFGAVFRQPWFDRFDFELAATWFNIDIADTVESIDARNILNRCYLLSNRDQTACDRITRSPSPDPQQQVITQIDAGFINIGTLTAQGLDLNARFGIEFDVHGETFNVSVSSSNTFMSEQLVQIDDTSPVQDNVGLIGTPEWQSVNNLLINWENVTFFWRSRFIDGTSSEGFVNPANPIRLDPLFNDGDPNTVPTWISHGIVEDVWYHDASITYDNEDWTFRFGVNNLFDKEPPRIDQDINGGSLPGQIFSNRNNAVTAAGFDFLGRTYFANVTKRF